MTVCSTTSGSSGTGGTGGFPTATTMGQLATNYALISQEQCMIQAAILAAANNCPPNTGQFCTTVGGNTPMTFVSGVGSVTVTNGGAGYYQDSPSAIVVPPIGSTGSGAVVTLTTNGGNILAVNVVSGGTNYQPINATIGITLAAARPISTLGTITPGSGYTDGTYTNVSLTGGSGNNATATVIVSGGAVSSVTVANAGTGYLVGDLLSATTASLGGTGSGFAVSVLTLVLGTGAILQPLVNAIGQLAGVNIVAAGSGYLATDTLTATRAVAANPAYTNASLIITAVSNTGAISSVAILNGGSGYQPSVATINIVSTINNTLPYPLGTGFQATVLTNSLGVITQVVVSNTGYGYAVDSPYLVITDPGTGAMTQVTLTTPPGPTSVASIAVTAPGENYDQAATGVVLNPSTAPAPTTPATVVINVPNNTYGTNANAYYQAWAGTQCNAALSGQLNSVISYFTGLGYTISLQTNPATGNTLQWSICW